jgi:hypothetical protein
VAVITIVVVPLFVALSVSLFSSVATRPHDDDEGASPIESPQDETRPDRPPEQHGSCLSCHLQDSIDRNLPSASRAWQDSSQLLPEGTTKSTIQPRAHYSRACPGAAAEISIMAVKMVSSSASHHGHEPTTPSASP